jgi:hypothetical protein
LQRLMLATSVIGLTMNWAPALKQASAPRASSTVPAPTSTCGYSWRSSAITSAAPGTVSGTCRLGMPASISTSAMSRASSADGMRSIATSDVSPIFAITSGFDMHIL